MEKAVHAKYTPHVVILGKYEQGRGRQSTEEERALKHVSKTHTLTKSHLFKLMCSTYWKKMHVRMVTKILMVGISV